MERMDRGLREWMAERSYASPQEFVGRVFARIEDAAALGAREAYPYTIPPDAPYVPVADADACSACGTCVRGCIYGALSIGPDRTLEVDGDRCWSCGFCVGVCPEGALTLRDRREPGRVMWDNRGTARPFGGGRA